MSTNSKAEHQPSDLLPRRRKSRSKNEDIQYQRFLRNLNKDVQMTMEQFMRENSFDPRDHPSYKTDPSIRLLRTTVKSRQSSSIAANSRHTERATGGNRSDPLSFLRYNETKRLAADVETILTGPAMKDFYTQFIRRSRK